MSGNWSLGWLVGTKHFPESKTRQLCGNTHYCANARFTLTMRRKQKSMKTHVCIWTVQIVIASIARISWKTMTEEIMSQVNEEIKYVIPLTVRRLRFDSVAEDFFQMVGNILFFKFLFMPFIGNARVKQSLVKCSEQTANCPTGLKFFRCMDTKLFHFNITLPEAGELWIEIPNSSFFTFPQS